VVLYRGTHMQDTSPSTTLRLSLGSIILGFFLLFVIGIAGGYLGYRLAPAPLTVLPNGDRTIVPVSQHVTISPSKTGEDIVATQAKSVLLLVEQTTKGIKPVGNGITLTNDGVVVSTQSFPDTALSAVLDDGSIAALTPVGVDTLSGLTFFRIPDQILPPVTLAQSAANTGSEVISIARNTVTMRPTASRHTVSEITAPNDAGAPGIQQVALVSGAAAQPGTAFFNDEGRLVGILRIGEISAMISVPDITAALGRLSAGTLTENPFAVPGFIVTWKLVQDAAGIFGMRAVVATITPKGPAFTAGIKVGDILTSNNGKAITWDSSLAQALAKPPFILSLIREGEERTITLP